MANQTDQNSHSTKREVNWFWVLIQLQVNVSAIFSLVYLFKNGFTWSTLFFSILVVFLGWLGETAGSHRLWAHHTYEASKGLKIFLMLCQTAAGSGTIYGWVRWHRLHHKHFKTELDPFNPKRGFFYSHYTGWTRKLSPAQEKVLEEIDFSDLENDKIVMFQKRWYYLLAFLFVFLLPTNAPIEYWGETMAVSIAAATLRYAIVLNLTLLIQSATIIWDLKAGEKYPMDSNWVFVLVKTYWLSYHYLASWDYQTSEYGKYGDDVVTKFIRACAALELANNLKTIDSRTVRSALTKSVAENKNISECLLELSEKDENVPKDHYLNPKKFY
ncbi:acyl-CoA Delta(11) desaturase [Sitophilus oryzae]|uniref:Acyl-CoA Delta(11) desaturase n=1 Tax=Sitophilus oryzae TaxID=7048 RepID=A0A6J2XJK4_SITOR|nr:acyl-CoA Delta(11) desaturase [Sitophilus oryzae]